MVWTGVGRGGSAGWGLEQSYTGLGHRRATSFAVEAASQVTRNRGQGSYVPSINGNVGSGESETRAAQGPDQCFSSNFWAWP